MNAQAGVSVDHRNGDGLDNRRSNLRPCSHSQNMCSQKKNITNKSGFKGVNFCKQQKRWRADITSQGKRYNLGRYDTKEEAKKAYDKKAKKLFGSFFKSG